MLAKLSNSADLSSLAEAEDDAENTPKLTRRQKLTRMFLVTSHKLNDAKMKLREKEENFRQIKSEQLAKVNRQSELIKRLQQRQAKLLKFIEEQEPSSPEEDVRAEPIGESCSEESLLSASSYTGGAKHKLSAAAPQQSGVRGTSHRKAINQARAEFFNKSFESQDLLNSDPHRKFRSGSLPPVITVTTARDAASRGARSKSEEKQMKSAIEKNKARGKKSASGPLKALGSSIAEQVTARLYNPDKIRQSYEAAQRARQEEKARKVNVILLC